MGFFFKSGNLGPVDLVENFRLFESITTLFLRFGNIFWSSVVNFNIVGMFLKNHNVPVSLEM